MENNALYNGKALWRQKRMTKRFKKLFIIGVLTMSISHQQLIQGAINKNRQEIEMSTKGLFSWDNTDCYINKRQELSDIVDQMAISEIYQSNLFDLDEAVRKDYIGYLQQDKAVKVYALTGDPSWYNNVKVIQRRIDEVVNYNKNQEESYKIAGIVLDIEPWVLGEGKWDEKTLANTLKKAYSYSQGKGIEFVVVIPFWLQEKNLETIIAYCDKTIVMNYNLYGPVEFIKEEVALAKAYSKPIISAAETKEPGEAYGILEHTTYYNVGLEKLLEDWQSIEDAYQYEGVGFALHDLKALKVFLEKEVPNIEQ